MFKSCLWDCVWVQSCLPHTEHDRMGRERNQQGRFKCHSAFGYPTSGLSSMHKAFKVKLDIAFVKALVSKLKMETNIFCLSYHLIPEYSGTESLF